ncbi:MAG TPA: DeoR/GlpR transcriptional regulator [Firmicutes bacterium]|jgi:DeoR family transcriptional regulator, fructose operon transcriptional repressor|nr:DeoR/GlpR transcriptional regulator [Bacillota bacterium]
MFGAQRLQKIREIAIDQEIVDVPSLSKQLGVSEVTIRRDLDKLEEEGFITKTYGGAIINKDFKTERDSLSHKIDNKDEINLISEIVLQMIEGNESIFLNGGSIGRQVAKCLHEKKKLMVITNDLFIATELYNNPNVKVTLTGGELVPSTGIMVGPCVLRMLKEIYINKAFIEVKGVDLKFGYSMESYDEIEIVKEVLNISKEVIAVADYNKFDNVGFTKLGDLSLFKKVISNKEISEEYKKYYFDNYIQLFTTYEVS